MGLRLRRCLGPVPHLAPAEYTVETASGKPAVSCPACGGISDLVEPYRVIAGGLVSPIWRCPFVTCCYEQFLSLEAWGEAVLR